MDKKRGRPKGYIPCITYKELTKAQKEDALKLKQQGYTINTIAVKMHVGVMRIERYFGTLSSTHQEIFSSKKRTQICPWCGRKFIPKIPTEKYCSRNCTHRMNNCKTQFYKSAVLLNKEQLKQLEERYYKGESVKTLSAQFGISTIGIPYIEFFHSQSQSKVQLNMVVCQANEVRVHRVSSSALYYS